MTLAFHHRVVPASVPGRTPLLLLHGTGGDENDLVPLGEALSPGAALLSPRGQVLERGMPRFFSRSGEGVFDPDEVRQRALGLADFIAEARRTYDLAAPIAVGFSNGANVAAVIMMLRPDVLAGAILLRPMAVLDDTASGEAGLPLLAGRSVLMLSGSNDPIVPAGSAEWLASRLMAGGAAVEHRRLQAGHNLTPDDMSIAKAWLALTDRIA
ncbi:alpha/beta hydrolase [Lichenihabitans psoromatis]|uniref:alpha/beta hydrolase n=1 Tax=Lichenihabitans psoromatis TaxID=2528642 RepID=UPI001036337C|nr:alpha/beta hydrolase [Lichenihabitans psoromatis]